MSRPGKRRPRRERQPAAPILSQGEIDILLGRGRSEGDLVGQTALHAMSGVELLSSERSPALQVAFARLARLMTASLRCFASDEVEVGVDEIASMSFGDYLNSIPSSPLVAVFRLERFDEPGLVAVDASLIRSAAGTLLGGRRGWGPSQHVVERIVVRRMLEVVLADTRHVFAPRQAARVRLDRIEADPWFAMTDPLEAAIVARLRIGMGDRGGQLDLVLPCSALAAIPKAPLATTFGKAASLSARTVTAQAPERARQA
ncbi:MAG: hypothetical protein ACREH4_12560 [Vitreimonas sp.]